MKKNKRQKRSRRRKKESFKPMLLTSYNYKLLFYGILSIIVGFGSMYIESRQFGFVSLYIAPLLVLGGFAVVAMAIFRTDPQLIEQENAEKQQNSGSTSGTE